MDRASRLVDALLDERTRCSGAHGVVAWRARHAACRDAVPYPTARSNALPLRRRVARCAMKLLVTGANGFLGRYVVAEALRRGHAVRAVVRSAGDVAKNGWQPGPNFELRAGGPAPPQGLGRGGRGRGRGAAPGGGQGGRHVRPVRRHRRRHREPAGRHDRGGRAADRRDQLAVGLRLPEDAQLSRAGRVVAGGAGRLRPRRVRPHQAGAGAARPRARDARTAGTS